MLQIYELPVAADNAVADHLWSPALLRHLVSIERLTRAYTAVGSMRALKAGVEAGVAKTVIAMTITRKLIHDRRQFRGRLICGRLDRLSHSLFSKLLFSKNRGKHHTFRRRLRMECGNLFGLATILRLCKASHT